MNNFKSFFSSASPDEIHDVTFDDSDTGRSSIAQRFYLSSFMAELLMTEEYLSTGATRNMLVNKCKEDTSQSHVTCTRIVNNGLKTMCESLKSPFEESEKSICQKVSYSNINIVNTSSPWFSGVIGLFGGFIIAVIATVVLHSLFFGKRNMMVGPKRGSTNSK